MDGILELWRITEEVSSLLKWVFFGCSLLSVTELVQRPNLAPKRPICVTVCDIGYLFCNILTASMLCRINATYIITEGPLFPNLFVAVSVVWLTFSAIFQRWKGLSASSFMCALHAIYFVAAITDLLTFQQELLRSEKITLHSHDQEAEATILVSSLGFAALGSFVLAFCRSSPVVDRNTSKIKIPADEETFSPFGKLVGQAVFRPVINAARRSKTTERDIRPLIRRLKCGSLFKRLYSPTPPKWTGQGARVRILSSFCRILWAEALWVLLTGFAYFGTLMMRVPLLEGMIENVARQEGKALTILFISTCIAEFCLSGFLEYAARRLSIQLKILMEAALFTKMTHMSARTLSATPAGYLVSLVGIDCEKLNTAMVLFSRSLSGLMCLPIVLWMLSVRVGALPVAGCIIWQAVAMALFVPATKLQTSLWRRIMQYRDERVRKLTDTLSCVRLVKFYAWEEAVAQAVTVFRDREGFFIFLVNQFDGFVDSLQNSSSSLMTIIVFGAFASLNHSLTLTAAATFSSLYMLSIIDVVIMNLAAVLRYNSMAWEGLRRMTGTLTAEEEPARKNGGKDIPLRKGHVLLEDCSLTWSEHEAKNEVHEEEKLALSNVNVNISPGAFVGVVGLVGSGKSALLTAMLGELQSCGGTLHVGGRVAYLPQTACIFNMTIRDNILFGRRMEPLRYSSVLEACELASDLEMLPAGDLTEVGEKGETLSGGQRQRLVLARAVYSDSDVYLMDDPLSGLDVHVASKVFAQVIGPLGILSNKTRVVACNQAVFLEHADQLLFVWEKHVVSFGSVSELAADPRVPNTMLFGSKRQSSPTKHWEIGSEITVPDEDQPVWKLTSEEQRDADLGTLELLRSFATMSGVCLPLALLCSVARAVVVAVFLCWIKMWIDASSTADNGGRSNTTWVAILAVLCLSDLIFGSLGGCLLALSFRRLSSRLHCAMLRSLLRCPISFFDTTPRGRVLNRFSADLDFVDCQLFMTSKEVFQTVSVTMARLSVIGTQATLACGFGILATCVYIAVVAVTVRTSNDLRSLENAWLSRMLQHLTETRDSMSSVRCYGAVKLVCRHFYRLVDCATHPSWAMTACVRFTRVSGGAAGLFAVLALVLTVVFSASPPSQSGVGLALSSAISIPMFLSNVNAALFYAFLAAIGFERAVEYSRLPAEDDCTGKVQNSEGNGGTNGVCPETARIPWPTEGKVVFDNVTASYNRDGLPPALKDVSFVIRAREKVGVVGRTGAGKSSLILALLRVLKPSKGRIVIDGIDVASASLRMLRSVVTVIPQEPYLMKGTLRDNLDATKCHSDEQVWEALRKAHMEEFVSKHPQGLLLEIAEGAENLSAGQRQLLCIARALLRSPRVLLLDEATSRMDGDTDRMIQRTLREGFSACTVLTIAHRLHTILHCDRILVMSEGSVAEHGTVAELAANPNSVFQAMARAAGIDLSSATTDGHISARL